MVILTKNGFQFQSIPLEHWNSDDDYCLACHKLTPEQSTVEFSGSWSFTETSLDGSTQTHTYNLFHIQFEIYVENSSSKWVFINSINYMFTNKGGGFTRDGGFSMAAIKPGEELPKEIDQSYYQLLWLFNSNKFFDLSQLTLTQDDRLDAKGTYYINWQTYQFQNNGKQLIKNAINSGFDANFIISAIEAVLKGLSILGIEEWLPGDTKKLNIEIYDKNKTSKFWKPLMSNAYLYLDNRHANINYCDYDVDVFHQTDNYYLKFTYYVKEDSYTKENAIPYIEGFTFMNWSSDKQIQVSNSNLSVSKTVSTIQGPDAIWKEIQFITYKNILEQLKCNYPRFGFFSLKLESVEQKNSIYLDYIYNTDADKFRIPLNFTSKPNNPYYFININGSLDDKIEVGSTEIYDVYFLLPSDAYALNDIEKSPLEVKDLNVKVVNDKNKSFTASLTDINISEYSNGNVGTAKLNVTCNNKDFSTSTRIEVSLNPRWEYI